jgi:hypothetical protein
MKSGTGGKTEMSRKIGILVTLLWFAALVSAGPGSMASSETEDAAGSDVARQPATASGSGEFDVIILDNEGYKRDRRGPVTFSHKKHALNYRVLCWECHHVYEDEENTWAPWQGTRKCRECHDPVKRSVSETRLQRAFHLNCKVCHKELAVREKEAGSFRECTGCHE